MNEIDAAVGKIRIVVRSDWVYQNRLSCVSPSLSFASSPQYGQPAPAHPDKRPPLRHKEYELEYKIHAHSVSYGGCTFLSSVRLVVAICNGDSCGFELFFRSEVVTVGSPRVENSVSNCEQYPSKVGFRISAARPYWILPCVQRNKLKNKANITFSLSLWLLALKKTLKSLRSKIGFETCSYHRDV